MIKRTGELKQLQNVFDSSHNQIVLVYGNLRSEVGTLVEQFVADKKVFYYKGRNASPQKQLDFLKKQVENQYGLKIQKNTYDECFTRIKSGDSSKLVVVIDGFDTVVRRDNEFYNSIINLKKRKLYPGPVMIVLCVSSLSWVRKDMESTLADKVSSIDLTIHLKDMTFLDIVRTFPKYSVAQAVCTYGILGGVPAYVDRWDGTKSIKENVCVNILDKWGFMHDEAEAYISSELRELTVYDTILSAMADGNEKLNDLYQVTGYSRAKISVYLKNLALFDVVEKVVSFETGGWDNAKKGVYRINNHFIDFWFRFIYPNMSDLVTMKSEDFYDKYIEPGLDEYLRRYFVDVCKEYLSLINQVGKCTIKIEKMGTWVGKEGTIDVIGRNKIRENVVGITNWDQPMMTYERYEALLSDMKSARISAKTIYLFSATAFDDKLKELEKSEDSSVVLIDMTEL